MTAKTGQRELPGDVVGDIVQPAHHHPNRLEHLVRTGALREIAEGPGIQQLIRKRIVAQNRHRDYLDRRRELQDVAGGLDAADARHIDVHQHQVRRLPLDGLERILATRALAYHVETVFVL